MKKKVNFKSIEKIQTKHPCILVAESQIMGYMNKKTHA